ncbi:MAG: hypothetical protein ACYC69_12405 [Thermodesulfovibrionales bacterium]
MPHITHASIAYIAGRLISGRDIVSLYDYNRACSIDIPSLPVAEEKTGFDYVSWSHMKSGAGISKYKYDLGANKQINISIKGSTFIVYMQGNATHFMGTVRGDTIYIYDQTSAGHFNFRMSCPAVEP